ncbi:ribbon-helix-helix protein, CopG family [Coleofasciculus sp. E2-BRE-01]
MPDKEYEALKKLSANTQRSINDLIREAVRRYAELSRGVAYCKKA